MAKQIVIKPLGKVLIAIAVVVLILVGLQLAGVNIKGMLFPSAKKPKDISKSDFAVSLDGKGAVKGAPGDKVPLKRPIKVGIVTWGGYAAGILANNGFAPTGDSVFAKKHGVKVQLKVIDDFNQSRTAFKLGGDSPNGVDIVWSTVDSYALEWGLMRKLKARAVIQYDWSRGGDAIAVVNSINSFQDLRGKKIALAEGTPSHFFGLFVLAQGGVGIREVQFVKTKGAPQAANEFKAGRVDACVSWDPDVYLAAKARQGAKIMVSTKQGKARYLIADIFVARGDFIAQHAGSLSKFVHGWLDGVRMIQTPANRAKAIRLMATNFSGVKLTDAKRMLSNVYLPNFADNARFFSSKTTGPRAFDTIFASASRLWKKINLLEKPGKAKEAKDVRFLMSVGSHFKGDQPEK